MPTTNNQSPVDIVALRDKWISIVDKQRAIGITDERTSRVARRCCWSNIASDLLRYNRIVRSVLLKQLFDDPEIADELEWRLTYYGSDSGAGWLEERLGVKIDGSREE